MLRPNPCRWCSRFVAPKAQNKFQWLSRPLCIPITIRPSTGSCWSITIIIQPRSRRLFLHPLQRRKLGLPTAQTTTTSTTSTSIVVHPIALSVRAAKSTSSRCQKLLPDVLLRARVPQICCCFSPGRSREGSVFPPFISACFLPVSEHHPCFGIKYVVMLLHSCCTLRFRSVDALRRGQSYYRRHYCVTNHTALYCLLSMRDERTISIHCLTCAFKAKQCLSVTR